MDEDMVSGKLLGFLHEAVKIVLEHIRTFFVDEITGHKDPHHGDHSGALMSRDGIAGFWKVDQTVKCFG